jgi:hypothetical protein
VSLETMVRLPNVFGAWCGVQTAINPESATRFVEKIASAQTSGATKPMAVITSTQDHWKRSSDAIDTALSARKMPHRYRVIPGPHDQEWLREAGTIEAMSWLDRLSYGLT